MVHHYDRYRAPIPRGPSGTCSALPTNNPATSADSNKPSINDSIEIDDCPDGEIRFCSRPLRHFRYGFGGYRK